MPDNGPTLATDCPGCGMPRDMWPDDSAGGVVRAGAIFCCTGCADGECTCEILIEPATRPNDAPTT